DIRFSGDLQIAESEARELLEVQSGNTFSRSELNASTEALRQRLGTEGFAFAEVEGIPQVADDNSTVDLVIGVDPGQRTYVRRIEFVGNTTTQDEVLRREMVQLEGAPASTEAITQSRQRLQRLGFFSQVEVDTRRVPGETDQLDVTYNVEEQPSGSISASIGFSQSAGVIYGASLSQKNFLGTGNRVNVGAQRSDTFTSINFGFTDPYWTLDGISRGYNVFYRETDYEDSDISTYSTDAYGAGINFGYPISELSRLNFGASLEDTTIKTYFDTASEIERYVRDEGENAQSVKLTGSWTRNNLNRGMMPTAGSYQRISLETAAPGSDVGYYKARARAQQLFPIDDDHLWALKFSGNLGYADTLGGNDPYPFYENFYAGGLGSVRGFTSNTLGQRTTPQRVGGRDRTMGGNVLVEGSAEMIFPMPFIEDQSALQSSVFFDAGNTFLTSCYDVLENDANRQRCNSGVDLGDLRYSVGVGLSWLTPVGPLTFSVAEPVNDESDDDTQFFQFSLGQTF
ncbi:MAG: outer membrane protein assembly factor BamA, partial [Pseudomonadota bacterium]